MGLFVAGGVIAHSLIPDVSGQEWSAMMEQAVNLNKTVIVDWNDPKPFIYGLLGGFLFDMKPPMVSIKILCND